jgi:DNA topoisomerase-1
VLRELGPHPKDKKPVVLYRGRFGPYLKHGKQIASLPKGRNPDDLSLEEAAKLLQEKAAKGKGKATGGTRTNGPRQTAGKATGQRGRTARKASGQGSKP